MARCDTGVGSGSASDKAHAASASPDRSVSVSAAIFACTSVHNPFLPQTGERRQAEMR